MKNFKTLKIWQLGMSIVLEVYKVANQLPNEEKHNLRSQITRAAVSIPSNIAEGCSRNGIKDCKRYFEIALGSAFELETQMLIIQKLQFADVLDLIETINNEQRMIGGFIQKLKTQKPNF